MAYAIVTTDGTTYSFSEFEGVSYNNYSSANPVRDFRCTQVGANIPIYTLWEQFYTSDFERSEHVFRPTGSSYGVGTVLALTDINENGIISAIIAYKRTGSTYPDYQTRLAERDSGEYNVKTPIVVSIRYIRGAEPTTDYSKFRFTDGDWFSISSEFESGYSTINIMGVWGWSDGVSTILGATLCFPFIVHCDTSYTCLGLGGSLWKDNNVVNFSDLSASENEEDFCGFYRGATCEFTYRTAGFIAGENGVKFQDDFHSGYEPYFPPEYPFEDDSNEGGGGTGDYRDTSDTIPIDGTPTNSAIASGFVNAYLLTQQNVNDFHAYLYSTDFLDNVKKLMNDPIDYILAFMLAPYTPDTSAATNIMIGGTNSEVAATRISSGYKTLDCGTITLSEFWGKFYDYNPYTKVQIYLPFIGMRPLDVDDVMAGDVNLKYRIDVLTGACVATISVNNSRGENGAVYSFNGNCHSHIPVSGKNYLETVTNVISAGVGMAGSIASGNALGVATGAINVMRSAKEQLEHAGELTGVAGLLANYTPFLMVSRPSQSLAANYNHYKGFISNVTRALGDLSGFTQVAELVQTNIHCTLDEFDEINELLKEGVYL